MKTREEVEKLKADWANDPCWDIEETEGFAEYALELLAFRKSTEAKWSRESTEKSLARARLLGFPGAEALGEWALAVQADIEESRTRIRELLEETATLRRRVHDLEREVRRG